MFKVAEFRVEPRTGYISPFPCKETKHTDENGNVMCFRSDATPLASEGLWKLRNPISIPDEFLGTPKRIYRAEIKGLYHLGFGTVISQINSKLKLIVDGQELFNSDRTAHHQDSWATNIYNLDLNLDTASSLDVQLYQHTGVSSGGVNQHDAYILLHGEYYSETPPPTATVTIDCLNRDTLNPLGNVELQLLDGTLIVASTTSDGDGKATLTNVNEGSYKLTAKKSGFEFYDTVVNVQSPTTYQVISLTPIPQWWEDIILPDWWWIPAGGAAFLIGWQLFAPKPQTPITLVTGFVKDQYKKRNRTEREI